jgi:hypothetical protein
MCQRQEIMAAHDIITKIPDEMKIGEDQLLSIVVVLRLLTRLLEQDHDQ